MSYKYVLMFENDMNYIVEIKRKDLPEDTPKEKVYFWLKINKESKSCNKLSFLSMVKEPYQKRFFNEGILTFDYEEALYNSEKYKRIEDSEVSLLLNEVILKFLSEIK